MIKKMIILTGLMITISILAKTYNEAPEFKKLVKTGKLPPVEKRLPQNPLVVKVTDEIGTYGGTVQLASKDLNGFEDSMHIVGFEPPLFLNPDQTVTANIIDKWVYSKDYKKVKLHIREGVKWSDGAPLTADDIMYWWNDEVQNKDLTEIVYTEEFRHSKFKKVDALTVEILFDVPYPLFDLTLAKKWGYLERWWRPKHYLKQFNPNYVNKKKLEIMAKNKGFDTLMEFYQDRSNWGGKPKNLECPVLTAYKLVEKKDLYWIWERNPYYFKVDEEGNQLPYIDKVIDKKIKNNKKMGEFLSSYVDFSGWNAQLTEKMMELIINGEIDFAAWNTKVSNISLYKQNEKLGGYRTLIWKTSNGSEVKYRLNLNTTDKQLNPLFNNVKFRQALSLAINRNEINDLLYFGKAFPRQGVPLPESKYYNNAWKNAYVKYDPVEANKLLDEIGLNKRDAEDYRLDKDGKRVQLKIEFWDQEPVEKSDISELVKEYWGNIGIKVLTKSISGALWNYKAVSNELQVDCWSGGGVGDSEWVTGGYPPIPGTYAPLWEKWYMYEGKKGDGEEPPEYMRNMMKEFKTVVSTIDSKERIKVGKQLWNEYVNRLLEIGTVGMAPYPIIVNKKLRNIPESATWGTLWLHSFHPEQFYFEK